MYELEAAGYPEWVWPEIDKLFRAAGCASCANTGYRGRIGLYEVMPMTEEIERLTVDRASSDQMKQVAIEQGMQTLRDDGLEKARTGMTSIEEVARVVK
jgi:type IV pilus assembly protein PilB